MVTRLSRFVALLIIAAVLAGCGMGQRYAQNYATYTKTMDDCSSRPTTITVPGPDGQTTTIEQPNPTCQNIAAPDHELRYMGPIISNGISTGVNAAVTVYQTERTTRSNERIAETNAEARTAEARYENETLQRAFDVAGPQITGAGNAVNSGPGSATAVPPVEESSEPEEEDPEPPEELTEDL